MKRITPSMVVSITALVFSTTGSAFAAKTLIDGGDIKNGSITAADIKDRSLSSREMAEGSISLDRLSDGTQRRINEKPRDGKDGANGTNGTAGKDGVNGSNGSNGKDGSNGRDGKDGADASHAITSLVPYVPDQPEAVAPQWGSVRGASIDANGIKFGPFTNATDFQGAYSYGLKGVRLKDIANLAYSTHYTGGTATGAAPYILIVTAAGDHIAFSPNTQSGVTPKAGTWQRWVVTKGSVRYDDDAGNGPDMSWDNLVNGGHGGETIDYVQVQAGNTGAAIGSTSHVRNVTMEASGAEATFASYTFGS